MCAVLAVLGNRAFLILTGYPQLGNGTLHISHAIWGALMMGIAFGAGWTPCVGPFLASLLALASSQDTVSAGVLLLLVYALGLGLPFLLAGIAIDQSLSVMRGIRPHMVAIERFSGVLLIGMGVLLFTEQLTRITSMLTRVFGTGLAV